MKFNEWWAQYPFRSSDMNGLCWDFVPRSAWNAALDSAIKACEECAEGCYTISDAQGQETAEQCLESIRALKGIKP